MRKINFVNTSLLSSQQGLKHFVCQKNQVYYVIKK